MPFQTRNAAAITASEDAVKLKFALTFFLRVNADEQEQKRIQLCWHKGMKKWKDLMMQQCQQEHAHRTRASRAGPSGLI